MLSIVHFCIVPHSQYSAPSTPITHYDALSICILATHLNQCIPTLRILVVYSNTHLTQLQDQLMTEAIACCVPCIARYADHTHDKKVICTRNALTIKCITMWLQCTLCSPYGGLRIKGVSNKNNFTFNIVGIPLCWNATWTILPTYFSEPVRTIITFTSYIYR